MNFQQTLPTHVKEILLAIEQVGFRLTVVGGAARDFFKDHKLSKDLDFEIRSDVFTSNEALVSKLTAMDLIFELMPYEIIQIKCAEFDLELSAPRIEVDIVGENSHHHFSAEINYGLSYEESFKRRDFTINAIGIELDLANEQERVVDPYNGLVDLNNKILREVSSSLAADYVRFLRLIRFSVKYNFSIADSILRMLPLFNLSHISKHYIKNEMLKSKNIPAFIKMFFDYIKKYSIAFDARFLFLRQVNFGPLVGTEDVEEFMGTAYLYNDYDTALDFCLFLGMTANHFKEMDSFYKSYKVLESYDEALIKNQKFEEIIDFSFYKELKNYFEKIKWLNFLNLTKLYNEELFQSTRVEDALMLKTSKEKRSFLKCYLFYHNDHRITKL